MIEEQMNGISVPRFGTVLSYRPKLKYPITADFHMTREQSGELYAALHHRQDLDWFADAHLHFRTQDELNRFLESN